MANPIKAVKVAKKAAERVKTNAIQKNSVKVKPAAKQKPNKPSMAKVEYKFGMGINRMRAKGNSVELGNSGRKNRIQANILNKKNKKAK